MTNNVALDVAIGLVFIFLLYSLLATTIKETIATIFSLRARMLKKGIVDGMLSNTPDDNRWESILKGIWGYIIEIAQLLVYKPTKKETDKKLGDKFYDHPLVKNYGSSRIFPTPSYIPTNNFSTVLIDVLKEDFSNKLNDIANFKFNQLSNNATLVNITQSLQTSSDVNKIKELLEYYQAFYHSNEKTQISNPIIENDTLQILQLHLKNSIYNIQNFAKKIEDWFDESMDRVSGWYKRQAQFILFIIGIFVAIIFNVDVIEIGTKLSKDKDARDKIVQLSIQAADKYKDDPRIKTSLSKDGTPIKIDSADSVMNYKIFSQYQNNIDSAKNLINGDIQNANNTLALGWLDYGRKRDSAEILTKTYPDETRSIINNLKKDTAISSSKNATAIMNSRALDSLYDKHWIKLKIGYVLAATLKGRKFLGFIILAFAVSLGSPFWFDLLNKLVKLRTSGKKEDGTEDDKKTSKAQTQQPITVNVNTQQTGEEAVG